MKTVNNVKVYEEGDHIRVVQGVHAGRLGRVGKGRNGNEIKVYLDPLLGEGSDRVEWKLPWQLELIEGAHSYKVQAVRDDGVLGVLHLSMPDSSFVPRSPDAKAPLIVVENGLVYQHDSVPVPESVYAEINRLWQAGLNAKAHWHAAYRTWYAKIEE